VDIDRLQSLHQKGNIKYRRPGTKLALACLLFLMAVLGPTPALAGQSVEAHPPTLSVPTIAVAYGPRGPEEMEAFLDGFSETKMAELQIPGAAIVVVQDGKVFLAKG
jgi:CubicO group peptidase (beta-lactamase class C family)